MDIITKEELEDKFELIKKSRKNAGNFWSAYFDYLQYLGESKELARIINKLALDNEIPAYLLQEIFDSSMKIPSHYFSPAFSLQSFISKKPEPLGSFTEEKIEYPPFWSKEIEEKFHLYKKYAESMDVHFDKKKISSKQSRRHHEKDKSGSDLSTLQKLHNNIIRKIYPPELLKKKVIVKKFEFESDKSILRINNTKIDIKKGGKEFLLLQALFRIKEDWLYELTFKEIAREIDMSIPPKDKSLYNAAYQLSKKIALKAEIDDFLKLTSKTLEINKSYIA